VRVIAFRELRRTWELLLLLTFRELKLRYQDTILGFVWSLIKPLLLGAVLYLALRRIVRLDIPDYHLFLLSALFPWTWFQTSVMLATPSFAHNGNLIKKVRFPRFVLPFSVVANNMVHFLLSIPILTLFILASGERPSPVWLVGIPLLTLIQLGLLMGMVVLLASLDVFFRDLEHLTEVFLNLWFYVTPILYPLSMVPTRLKPLYLMNPMSPLIEAWRKLFVGNTLPGPELWISVAFVAAAAVLGAGAFRRLEGSFADAL
jgi:ABC-type polysaccharide/polyol phosphate export permease